MKPDEICKICGRDNDGTVSHPAILCMRFGHLPPGEREAPMPFPRDRYEFVKNFTRCEPGFTIHTNHNVSHDGERPFGSYWAKVYRFHADGMAVPGRDEVAEVFANTREEADQEALEAIAAFKARATFGYD